MRQFIRIAIISACVALTALSSGCIVVPAGHRCGHYHCW